MDFKQLADLFYKELRKIINIEDKERQFNILYRTVNAFFNGLTKVEKIDFKTIFSRVSYTFHKYDIPSDLQWKLHEFRKEGQAVIFQNKPIKPNIYLLGFSAMCAIVEKICDTPIPDDLKSVIPQGDFYDKSPIQFQKYLPKARVVVREVVKKERLLICNDESQPQGVVKVRYDETAVNEQFRMTIQMLSQHWNAYTTVNLLDISIDEEGVYHPRIFVIEPDYLIDVSAIAGCFSNPTEGILYLLKKFLPFTKSQHLVVGNIANHFLDELMNDNNITFEQSFPKVFKANPLVFAMFDDNEVREIMHNSRNHFYNLRQMVKVGFEENDINPSNCYLEPSFFSGDYGIQGRLDIWYQNPESEQNSAIVELKSGSAFMANRYGISDSHYVQALLYDLMVKSVYQQKDPRNYILYSRQKIDNLRFAPVLKTKQNEALSVRNEIVTLEQMLVDLHLMKDKDFTILDKITPERYPNIKGFNGRDIQYFSKVFHSMNPLERSYFLSFCSFIAREHQLSKMGVQGNENINGLASLWLNPYEEKNENFDILSNLIIAENRVDHDTPVVVFERSESTNELANFRVGDIAILYPCNTPEKGQTALNSQIFKCSVILVDKYFVGVKLRFKQFNKEIFEIKTQKWILEHDQMDHSYNAMYRSLFAFLQFQSEKKSLLFTSRPPKDIDSTADFEAFEQKVNQLNGIKNMTEEQQRILVKALIAPEYFLLWGPPGTGKTSVMLRTIVEYLFHHTDENILLLAYTNRAVDEICEAIESVSKTAKNNYIRIGNRYSASEMTHHALFDSKIEKVKRRDELKAVIHEHRIFVATVASIQNRQELLQLKQFNRVIIDEASQILEPLLVGLLPQFERFILIGDHKQLPAVVQQGKLYSTVSDKNMKAIGLHDMRDSFFERLFLRCKGQKWDWAFDMLSHQGRMHRQIMDFPNRFFYEDSLNILPEYCGVNQSEVTNYAVVNAENDLEQQLAKRRVLYFSTPAEDNYQTQKINLHEAQKIAEIVHAYCQIYKANGIDIIPDKTIGIITPYRAQIAQIRNALEKIDESYTQFTVDTVERYQGGARDIILISLCLNHVRQLETLVSLDTEGKVDRKLNVALTRAKQHLVIVGNEELMRESTIYEVLLEWAIG